MAIDGCLGDLVKTANGAGLQYAFAVWEPNGVIYIRSSNDTIKVPLSRLLMEYRGLPEVSLLSFGLDLVESSRST